MGVVTGALPPGVDTLDMGPRSLEGEKSHRGMKAYSAEFRADGVAPYLSDHAPAAEKPTGGGERAPVVGQGAGSTTSATTQLMLSGPPASLAAVIRVWTASSGAGAAVRRRSIVSSGTTAERPSEQSR